MIKIITCNNSLGSEIDYEEAQLQFDVRECVVPGRWGEIFLKMYDLVHVQMAKELHLIDV